MSDIEQTIQRVKDIFEERRLLEVQGFGHHTQEWKKVQLRLEYASVEMIMPIISDRERLKAENKRLSDWGALRGNMIINFRSELSKAQQKIKELEKELNWKIRQEQHAQQNLGGADQ